MGLELPPEIPRKYGQPLITPLGGGDPVRYARISSFADAVEDSYNLDLWKQRNVALGLAHQPNLIDRIVGIVGNYDDPIDDAKRELNSICKDAQSAAGSSKGADIGTALHSMTQALDRGRTVLDGRWKAHLDAYWRATTPYEVLDAETFVVVDELQTAGTLDRLVRCPDGAVRVADVKTGKWELQYPAKTAAQVATYARGQRYDPKTGQRSPLHKDLDLSSGILIWLPVKADRATCQVVGLDLDAGWRRAQLAWEVRQERARTADDFLLSEPYPAAPVGAWTA
jgi:hypothetical protein